MSPSSPTENGPFEEFRVAWFERTVYQEEETTVDRSPQARKSLPLSNIGPFERAKRVEKAFGTEISTSRSNVRFRFQK